MLIAQVLNLLYSIVDRIYIGRIPNAGTQALGAVGLCFPVIIIITGFTNMFGLGGAPLFSMALGKGDKRKAAEIQNTAFRLLLLSAILLTILGELFGRGLLLLNCLAEDCCSFSGRREVRFRFHFPTCGFTFWARFS